MVVSVRQLGAPVDLRPWFPTQRRHLLEFLAQLSEVDWGRPTACAGWNVADLAAHIVGDVLGRLSGFRGGALREDVPSDLDLPQLVDRNNAEWVHACRVLHPSVLIDLLEWAGPQVDLGWSRMSLDDPSLGVSWAGLAEGPMWLDAAREVTEYWVHETQLREAVGDGGSPVPDVAVVLDVFARGLPSTFRSLGRDVRADRVTVVAGEARWSLRRSDGVWSLGGGGASGEVLQYDSDFLWRRWTRQPVPRPRRDLSPAERVVLNHVAIVHSGPDLW